MTDASNLHDHVRVHSDMDSDFHLQFNSRPYIIPAGSDAILPREAACIWFGDWTRRGDDRRKEYERIRGRYGTLEGFEGAQERWEKNRPNVRILEIDGSEVSSIINDPDGETLSIIGSSEATKEATIEAMQAQIQTMAAQLQGLQNGEVGPGSEVGEDSPTSAPRRTKRAPVVVPAREAAVGEE